jgi:hypothetical protein
MGRFRKAESRPQLLLALLAACANYTEPSRVCTEIGCEDGLAVEVNHSLQQSFTVTVRAGTQALHTFRCDPGQACRAFVASQTPEEVTIVIDAGGGQPLVSRSYRPEYRLHRPNGPDCPPECRQATVVLNVS